MLYGYARVSTLSQSLDNKVQDLKDNGVLKKNIYTDTSTDRVGFQKLLDTLKSDDTLVVNKLDKLARNTRKELNVIIELQNKNIKINILNLGLIDNSSIGKFMITVLLSVAEMERYMTVNRTQEGKKCTKKYNPNYRGGRRTSPPLFMDISSLTWLRRPQKYLEHLLEHCFIFNLSLKSNRKLLPKIVLKLI